MDYNYNKRDYLLPPGCKDLIDAWKKPQPVQPPRKSQPPPPPLPLIIREITVPEQLTYKELAAILDKKPFLIVADLMELNVFPTENQKIGFETIARVLLKYGYIAKKAA